MTLKTTVLAVSTLVLIFEGALPAQRQEPPATAPAASLAADVQGRVDALTNAIFAGDAAALSAILSSEALDQSAARGWPLTDFLEKQRTAIGSTFGLGEGERPAFAVADVLAEGDAVRVTLRFRGETLAKPFYFVREQGVLKFNFGPPGFSKQAPAGALLGKSNYTVKNVNHSANQPFAIRCFQGNGVQDATLVVPAGSTRKVRCEDACGWYSGSIFQAAAGDVTRKCDWNWWGADVIINLLDSGGWRCNDTC